MQSIDINQILSNENIQALENKKETMKFDNCFKDLLIKNRTAFIISNYTETKVSLLFLVNLSNNSFNLIETKKQKHRSFNIDFKKQFFTIGKRRGFQKDIDTLKERLKKVTGFILSKSPTILVHFNDKTEKETPFKKELSSLFNMDISAFSKVKNIPEKFIHSIVIHFKHFIKSLYTVKDKPKEDSTKLQDKINEIQNLFIKMIGDESKIVVTNSTKKKRALNSVYTLVITKELSILVEESPMTKNKIILNDEEKKYTLNNENITLTSINWFTKKLENISSDIGNNIAQVLVGEKR